MGGSIDRAPSPGTASCPGGAAGGKRGSPDGAADPGRADRGPGGRGGRGTRRGSANGVAMGIRSRHRTEPRRGRDDSRSTTTTRRACVPAWKHRRGASGERRGTECPDASAGLRACVDARATRWLGGWRGGTTHFDTYLKRPARHRNECWEADHCELAIEVCPPGRAGHQALGHVVSRPLLASVSAGGRYPATRARRASSAALRAAILTEPPSGRSGGSGGQSDGTAARSFWPGRRIAARALGIDATALPPYSPHLKGAIERFHESIEAFC